MGIYMKLQWSILYVVCICTPFIYGFYLPGVKMVTYTKGTNIPIYVNSLTSAKTLLPLEYYKLPFCEVFLNVNKSSSLLRITK